MDDEEGEGGTQYSLKSAPACMIEDRIDGMETSLLKQSNNESTKQNDDKGQNNDEKMPDCGGRKVTAGSSRIVFENKWIELGEPLGRPVRIMIPMKNGVGVIVQKRSLRKWICRQPWTRRGHFAPTSIGNGCDECDGREDEEAYPGIKVTEGCPYTMLKALEAQ